MLVFVNDIANYSTLLKCRPRS